MPKIGYHTLLTLTILFLVFMAGFFSGTNLGQAWANQSWKFFLLAVLICGNAYALIWNEQLRHDPDKDEDFKRRAGPGIWLMIIGTFTAMFVFAALAETNSTVKSNYFWWVGGAQLALLVIAVALYHLQARVWDFTRRTPKP